MNKGNGESSGMVKQALDFYGSRLNPELDMELINDQVQIDEAQAIEGFLHYLDTRGYNLWIIKAVRSLLKKGEYGQK